MVVTSQHIIAGTFDYSTIKFTNITTNHKTRLFYGSATKWRRDLNGRIYPRRYTIQTGASSGNGDTLIIYPAGARPPAVSNF